MSLAYSCQEEPIRLREAERAWGDYLVFIMGICYLPLSNTAFGNTAVEPDQQEFQLLEDYCDINHRVEI